MRRLKTNLATVVALAGLSAFAPSVGAQGRMPSMDKAPMQHMDKGKGRPEPPATIRITMEDLHKQGGVPRGWKFLMPAGDAAEGRRVFVAMECFACHEVKDEDFPRDSKTPPGAGPALTGMGGHHPPEYFAESIMNPNRVIVQGAGFTGADGLSKMPSYADTMTIKQLVDVVAYLKSLTGGEMEHGTRQKAGSMKMNEPMKMK